MGLNNYYTFLTVTSALFAIGAAVLWFISALVKTPDNFRINIVRPSERPLGRNPIGAEYIGQANSKDFDDLANALRKQSKFSALAAVCASVSAIFIVISLLS